MKYLQGWINLYKPKNISSFKAINKVKNKLFLDKIGHAGTLDPSAQGILPIAIGKTTKLIPFINNDMKVYNFDITWGIQTLTDDSDGVVINQSKNLPKLEDIKVKTKNFLGKIDQTPPNVSAVKIKGKRAYQLVRENKNFEIASKKVFVKNINVKEHKISKTSFQIECGKGFYIRSLARDLARDLKTFGHISHLEREKVGKFRKETSILLDDLLKIGQRLKEINCILPSISMLDDILAYEIENQNDIQNLSFGRPIKIDEKKLNNSHSKLLDKKEIFLSNNGDIVSIGKLVGNLFKPKKILL